MMKKYFASIPQQTLFKIYDIAFAIAFFTIGTLAMWGASELLKAIAFAIRGY